MHESPRPETEPSAAKLTAAVAGDFPEERDVLMSFPDEWQLVRVFRRDDMPLYAAAWPWETEKPRRDHFHGLSAEINLWLAVRNERQDELSRFWQTVEEDIGVRKIFTHPRDPAYPEGYTDLLSELGYYPAPDFPAWWSQGP